MKKAVSSALFCLLALFLASCSKETPTQVVEKALTSLQKEDFKGYVDQLYMKDSDDKEKIEKQKEEFTALLKEKYTQNPNGKLSKFNVQKEEIINDSTAKVTVELLFEKGQTKTETYTCRTDNDGNWRLQQNK